jgi:hypothetical protein
MANQAIETAQKILKLFKEVTGKARNKIYTYQKYLDILSEGSEAIPI